MKRLLFTGAFLFLSHAAYAEDAAIPPAEMKECRIKAANTAVEINPSFNIISIGTPTFIGAFKDQDKTGEPVSGQRFRGKIVFSVGDIKGTQQFTCTFVRYENGAWRFNWSGLGLME